LLVQTDRPDPSLPARNGADESCWYVLTDAPSLPPQPTAAAMVAKFGDPNPLSPHTYVCQVESDGQTIRDQHAASGCFGGDMDSVRRVLRGIFKRGKKRKQEEERAPKPPQPPAVPPKDTQTTPASPSPPPRAVSPPANHASPNAAAAAAAATAPEVANSPAVMEMKDEERKTHVGDDQEHASPQPNEDGVAVAVVAAPPEAAVASPAGTHRPHQAYSHALTTSAVTDSKPEHITSTGELDTQPTTEATEWNAPPHVTTPEASRAPEEPKSSQSMTRNSIEDKIPINDHEEPPPIRRVLAAPGMSATSGPLEDYPEGGDFS